MVFAPTSSGRGDAHKAGLARQVLRQTQELAFPASGVTAPRSGHAAYIPGFLNQAEMARLQQAQEIVERGGTHTRNFSKNSVERTALEGAVPWNGDRVRRRPGMP